MKCGRNPHTGSHWYSWIRGKVRVTLFPYHPNQLEMSIQIFGFYKVFHFGNAQQHGEQHGSSSA
jgi:hypothetical protein